MNAICCITKAHIEHAKMEPLDSLTSNCNVNLSSPVFADLLDMQDENTKLVLAEILAECEQDDIVLLMDDVWENYSGYLHVNNYLRLYVPPVLLFFGTFGNILSFVVLAKSMFRVGTYSYLTMLSIIDLFVLYIGLLRGWLGNFTQDIQHRSDALCNIVNILGYVCSDISVWLIVAVTTERFIAVNVPLKASRMNNVKRARRVIIGIILSLFALNVHFSWTVEINPDSKLCEAGLSYSFLVKKVWPWVDSAVYAMIPFLIIIILNSLSIRRIMFDTKKRSIYHMQSYVGKARRSLPRTIAKHQRETGRKLTCMLLAISFCFVLTTLPMNIFIIVNSLAGPGTIICTGEEALFRLAKFTLFRTVAELLMYLNHSTNFVLYCAMGESFRRQCKLMMSHCFKRKTRRKYSFPSRRTSLSVFKSGSLL